MNLYSEIVRDTSINPVKQIGDLASLFHRVNTVSTQKYHPLFFSPPHDKSGFSTSKGEKDISDTRISDYFRRPYGQDCLKPRFQELFSPPAGGRGILPCGISDLSEKITDFIPQGEGEGDLFSFLPASLPHAVRGWQALILSEQVGQQFIRNKNDVSFSKIESDSHWTTLI